MDGRRPEIHVYIGNDGSLVLMYRKEWNYLKTHFPCEPWHTPASEELWVAYGAQPSSTATYTLNYYAVKCSSTNSPLKKFSYTCYIFKWRLHWAGINSFWKVFLTVHVVKFVSKELPFWETKFSRNTFLQFFEYFWWDISMKLHYIQISEIHRISELYCSSVFFVGWCICDAAQNILFVLL